MTLLCISPMKGPSFFDITYVIIDSVFIGHSLGYYKLFLRTFRSKTSPNSGSFRKQIVYQHLCCPGGYSPKIPGNGWRWDNGRLDQLLQAHFWPNSSFASRTCTIIFPCLRLERKAKFFIDKHRLYRPAPFKFFHKPRFHLLELHLKINFRNINIDFHFA